MRYFSGKMRVPATQGSGDARAKVWALWKVPHSNSVPPEVILICLKLPVNLPANKTHTHTSAQMALIRLSCRFKKI